jgi:hypothetical protein
MAAEEKEITFYSDDRGVRVTNTRLMVPNTTYAMANISSVTTKTVDPSYGWPGLFILLGLGCAVGGFSTGSSPVGILGILLLGGGAYWAYSLKPDYHLRISSTGGESTALTSRDKGYVENLVAGIHEAIIHRG